MLNYIWGQDHQKIAIAIQNARMILLSSSSLAISATVQILIHKGFNRQVLLYSISFYFSTTSHLAPPALPPVCKDLICFQTQKLKNSSNIAKHKVYLILNAPMLPIIHSNIEYMSSSLFPIVNNSNVFQHIFYCQQWFKWSWFHDHESCWLLHLQCQAK